MASGRNMNNLMGGVFALLFGIFWISTAVSMGAPAVFPLFGLLFIAIAAWTIFSSLRSGKGSPPAAVDPAKPPEAPDLDEHHEYSGYCPYCGSPVEKGHGFCSVCGKRLRWTGGSGQ